MEFVNWTNTAMVTGGFVVGFLVGNSIAKKILDNMIAQAFQKGILTGLDLANDVMEGKLDTVVTPPEDYNESEMKVGE